MLKQSLIFAQSYSVAFSGGSTLSIPTTNSFYNSHTIQPNLGFAFTLGSEYQINKRWALLLDASFSSAKHIIRNSNPSIQTQYTNLFLETPLSLKYRMITNPNQFAPYIIVGVSSNFLLSSKISGIYPNIFILDYNEETGAEVFFLEQFSRKDNSDYRLFSLNFISGSGMQLWSKNNSSIGIEFRYTHSLQNFLKTSIDGLNFYNRILTGGIRFQFGL